tara:strand:- start:1522 stop:2799 length:1278 start_codon:yes stop_codon:yes gene_type:complete
MIPSFKQYLVEENREVFFSFGRMNPPTIGHSKLVTSLATKAGKNPYYIYLSQTNKPKKDPLEYTQKVKHVRKMFPKHGRNVVLDKKVRDVFDIAVGLYAQGFNKITMVVGSDRVTEFETLLNKYNGKEGRHGTYNFERITVISGGERDPDSDGVEGMSASKQRENARNNDFSTFSQGLPKNVNAKDAKKLFNDVRAGMGLEETTSFKNHIELESVSETREKFVKGELFNLTDKVVIIEDQRTGYIQTIGTNYVIVALDEGGITRQWIDSVERISERSLSNLAIDFIDKKLNAKKYTSAIQTFIKIARKNPDSNQNVVKAAQVHRLPVRQLQSIIKDMLKSKDAPKELLNYRKMFESAPEWGTDEATEKAKTMVPGQNEEKEDAVDTARKVIAKDDKLDKIKHDRIMDRARLNRARRKNKQTNPKV